MQWVQALGGKTTVVNKTLAINKGDSRHKMQTFGGRISQGLTESVQETASDLIQINEIREMSIDEQLIFSHGQKPIRCKKIKYYEHPYYAGKFDPNPVEEARRRGGN
jgi:type IV secretory pathway TraG/TraD family ATPase VirD4